MSNYQVDICHIQTSELKSLSPEQTIDLISIYQVSKDNDTKERIVMGNLKLVLSLVSRYKRDEMDDLFQVGCIGLVKAIEQFDLNQNVMFSTYAVPLIIGEIKAYIRNKSPFHISRHLNDLSLKVSRLKESYLQTYHHDIPKEQLLKQLDISSFDLYQIENLRTYPTSLSEQKSGQEHLSISDLIEDPKHSVMKMNNNLCLQNALSHLTKDDLWLIEQRYFNNKTQAEIANELFLSQAQVSRMEKKILCQLKNYFI